MAEEAQVVVENAGQSDVKGAFFSKDYYQRVRAMNFYEMTYIGGPEYKSGVDMNGAAVLIEHETETPFTVTAPSAGSIFSSMAASQPGSTREQLKAGRYARRWRIAAFENHYKPIVDKFVSYLTSNDPHRSERAAEEAKRLNLDAHMERAIGESLKITESWVGVDAARLPTAKPGAPAAAHQLHPQHGGHPARVCVLWTATSTPRASASCAWSSRKPRSSSPASHRTSPARPTSRSGRIRSGCSTSLWRTRRCRRPARATARCARSAAAATASAAARGYACAPMSRPRTWPSCTG